MIGCGKCISGLNTRQFVSVEARVVVILRRLVVVLGGSSRFSEPVVIIGEMSNTVTYRQAGIVFILILFDCLTVWLLPKNIPFRMRLVPIARGTRSTRTVVGAGRGAARAGWWRLNISNIRNVNLVGVACHGYHKYRTHLYFFNCSLDIFGHWSGIQTNLTP